MNVIQICFFLYIPVLPKSPPASSSDLDITIMYSMFRNTIDIPKPSKGWGREPDENDRKIGDDIERARIHRNKICHENSSEMTTADFNKSTLDLIGVSFRLSIKLHTSRCMNATK